MITHTFPNQVNISVDKEKELILTQMVQFLALANAANEVTKSKTEKAVA
jgi:hypothetical protein